MVRYAMMLGLALCAGPALAQTSSPPVTIPGGDATQNGRFSMSPTADGFLRLDTRSGAVSHCRMVDGNVQCRSGADERAALDAEIERLSKDNAELRRKLAAATDQAPTARLRNALPTDEEVNKAVGFMEQFMRRMMRVMRDEPAPKDGL